MWIVPKKSRSLHRNLAQEMIHSGVLSGLRSSYIVKSLKDAGLGYHLQNMYRDINGWKNALATWKNVNERFRNESIPSDLYIETNRHLEAKFETVLNVKVRNKYTGEEKWRKVTVLHEYGTPYGSSEMLENRYSINDLLNVAQLEIHTTDSDWDVISGSVEIGYRRA